MGETAGMERMGGAARTVAIVGAGRVGTAMAVLLARAGHRIVAVAGGTGVAARAAQHLPGVPVLDADEAATAADLVLIGTPDAAIAEVAAALARAGAVGPGDAVAHLSGATGLDALDAVRASGAAALCIHPLQTCPTVEAAIARIPGSAFAITATDAAGVELGMRIARDAGGDPFTLEDARKPLYHAAAVLASNDLVALVDLAQRAMAAAGVPDPARALAPIQRATLENLAAAPTADALTGPVLRGDAATVDANLRALADALPSASATYVALADVALDLATGSGRLDAEGAARVREVLDRWR